MRRAQALRGWDGRVNVVKDPPAAPRHRSRKDTKRWCRGKVGVEHRYEWVRDERRDYAHALRGERTPDEKMWWHRRCSECLREAEYCAGFFGECICGRHRKPSDIVPR